MTTRITRRRAMQIGAVALPLVHIRTGLRPASWRLRSGTIGCQAATTS